jgi:hypothetical protein
MSNFMQIRPAVLQLFHACKRTDGRSDFNGRSARLQIRLKRAEIIMVGIEYVNFCS